MLPAAMMRPEKNPFTPAERSLADLPSLPQIFLSLLQQAAASLEEDCEVVETEGAILVTIDLPGVSPESVGFRVEDDVLEVVAERKRRPVEGGRAVSGNRAYGRLIRRVELPAPVEAAGIRVGCEQGSYLFYLPRAGGRFRGRPRIS